MESAFIPASQAGSQPILPSQKSPYFRTINPDHLVLQDRRWLSPPPHASISLQPQLSRLSLAMASATGSMSPLTPVQNPYQIHHQPHPYFAHGPSAMGYIPQQLRRYTRNQGLQEPIVPLRKEFSSSQELDQSRPYSVPTHFTQTSHILSEQNAHPIPQRPMSVAHTNTVQKLADTDYLHGALRSEESGALTLSSLSQDAMNNSDSEIPPRRLLPFPTSLRTDSKKLGLRTLSGVMKPTSSPNWSSKTAQKEDEHPNEKAHPSLAARVRRNMPAAQLESSTSEKQLLSPRAAPTVLQTETRSTAKKVSSSCQTTKRKKMPVAQPKRSSESASPKKKPRSKRPDDALSPNNIEVPTRPVKIRLLGRFSDSNTTNCSSTGHKQLPSEANNDISQDSHHTHKAQEISPECSRSDAINPAPKKVNTSPQQVIELSHPCSVEFGQHMEAEKIHVAPNSCLSSASPRLSSYGDQSSKYWVSQQTLSEATTVSDKPGANSATPAPCRVTQRSASQASTMSNISSTTAKKDAKSNHPLESVLVIDETIVLEQDISNIIHMRLQQCEGDMLETMYAEILIKMAVKNEEIFESVATALQSPNEGRGTISMPAM